jgi:arginase family enzyme
MPLSASSRPQAADRHGNVPLTIGGDGSIAVPVVRALDKRYKNVVARHLDSHA